MKTYSRKSSSYLKKAFIASNFNEMCRLCLSESDLGLTPIFQEFSKISYQDWIQYSVDVLIEEGDGLPPNICEECLALVEQTYLFKKKCKASDSKLREHLELIELDNEEKLNEIGFNNIEEEHKNLFESKKLSSSKCDESSAVDSGGTESSSCEKELPIEEAGEEKVQKNQAENIELDLEEPQEKVVIKQVKRYILKGEKRADDQEEDLTVCEVVPLDVRNEESVSSDMNESTNCLKFECTNQNGHDSEFSNPRKMKIQEIYHSWDNEEEGEVEQEGKKNQDGIMILDVSWENGLDKSEKKQNLGILEVDVEQNGVVQLHTAFTDDKPSEIIDKTFEIKTLKNPEPNFKCFVCGKEFSSGMELKTHLAKFHHEVADAAFCEICGKSFVCINNLKRHMSIHTGYKPHKCKICGRGFSQGSILKRHVFTHETLKPFNCQICGKGYTQKMNLLSHFKNHGFRTEGESFSCHLCNKSFVHQSGLSRHLKLHKGIKFPCTHCTKTFVDSSALARHLKTIHPNVK